MSQNSGLSGHTPKHTTPNPGGVPHQTPEQHDTTQTPPSATPPSATPPSATPPSTTLPSLKSVSNVPKVSEQQTSSVGGAQCEDFPTLESAGSGDFAPQNTRQLSPSLQSQEPLPLRNDGDMAMLPMLHGNDGIPQRAGIDDRLPPSSSANLSAPSGGSTANPDQEKTKLIQQQLVLLLHAHKCLQKERESQNYRCYLPHCQVMKEVFRHIMRCQRTRDCSYPHCASSRQIIQHWRSCGKRDCSICMPVKGVIKPVNAPSGAVGPVVPAGVGGPVPVTIAGPIQPSTSLPMPSRPLMVGQPPAPGEQWQNSVRQDVRDHLVKKILNGIYPVSNLNSVKDNPQYSRLVQFIRRLEDNFFRTCTSKDEYFTKLEDKYQQIVKDLQRTSPGPVGMNPIVQPARPPCNPNQCSHGSQPPLDSDLSSSQPSLDALPSGPSLVATRDPLPAPNVGPDDLKSPIPAPQAQFPVRQEGNGSLAEVSPKEALILDLDIPDEGADPMDFKEALSLDLGIPDEGAGPMDPKEALRLDLDISDEGAGPKDPKEALSRAIQHFIQVLVHAAQCRDRDCKTPSCAKMKRIMHHVGQCKQCGVCKQFLLLCLQHAKSCKSKHCPVPLCAKLKKHLLDKQIQSRWKDIDTENLEG